MAKNRIIELKLEQKNRMREETILNHTNEREEVEKAHVMEYQDFNKKWDDMMMEEEESGNQFINALEEKHIRELEENRQNMENTLPLTFKQSAELLNMRRIQENLAKQKE